MCNKRRILSRLHRKLSPEIVNDIAIRAFLRVQCNEFQLAEVLDLSEKDRGTSSIVEATPCVCEPNHDKIIRVLSFTSQSEISSVARRDQDKVRSAFHVRATKNVKEGFLCFVGNR